MVEKLDILAFGAHPDDVELGCAGTILKAVKDGYKVGVIDLTQGELGTRGDKDIRLEESKKASSILGLSIRDNLFFKDGFIGDDDTCKMKIINVKTKMFKHCEHRIPVEGSSLGLGFLKKNLL